MASVTAEDVLLIILAILLPPVAVILMKRPLADILINVVLTLFFWIGGVIHALYLMYQRRKSWWRWYRNSFINFTAADSGQTEIQKSYVVIHLNQPIFPSMSRRQENVKFIPDGM
ncbi:uncharacterized protein ARMOST_11942 [Armillaria ostoyae]|uniref:Plasma membrane proteolipid 3 n=1 Tax=Armillaria ostoyae TaxID=47428 RepID=A0A284RII6_ARMOS|nr:uncharacterized protein ARMOST_11942 [Armillaria ostoyae]